MNKTEIYNTYAIKQGYECWDNLVNEKINEQRLSLYYDFNAVTDLIQEELIKKLHNEYAENNNKDWYDYTNQNKSALILNTENIK